MTYQNSNVSFPPSVPSKPKDLSYNISRAISAEQLKMIEETGIMSFHCTGDTGGKSPSEKDTRHTLAVAELMASQLKSKPKSPSFCYHVGDIVYPYGQTAFYDGEFYQPYSVYGNNILAIPGNHDSYDMGRGDKYMLEGFRDNFLHQHDGPGSRKEMNLPYYYWTLDTPVATIIGLCAIKDGIDEDQQKWFKQQVKDADKEKCLILAVHYPPYSFDAAAGLRYPGILKSINDAFKDSGRNPDLVISGHSHNYQRIQIDQSQSNLPSFTSIITGAGGIGMTPVNPKQHASGVSLKAYNGVNFGALKLTIDSKCRKIHVKYYIVKNDSICQHELPFDKFVIKY